MKIVILFTVVFSMILGCASQKVQPNYELISSEFISEIDSEPIKDRVTYPKYIASIGIPFSCECEVSQSQIFGKLDSEVCEDSCFTLIDPSQCYDLFDNNVFLVSTWVELEDLKAKYIRADIIDEIIPQDFNEHIFGFVLVTITDGKAIRNAAIYNQNEELVFAYEVWRIREAEYFCAWNNLYILKLKKSDL